MSKKEMRPSSLSQTAIWCGLNLGNQRMDFTTMDDTAAFTACAALDSSTPRFLRIAGDQLSARELAAVASEVMEKDFRLFRAGSLGMLGAFIKVARLLSPAE